MSRSSMKCLTIEELSSGLAFSFDVESVVLCCNLLDTTDAARLLAHSRQGGVSTG